MQFRPRVRLCSHKAGEVSTSTAGRREQEKGWSAASTAALRLLLRVKSEDGKQELWKMLQILGVQWQVEKDTGLVSVAAPVLGDSLGF